MLAGRGKASARPTPVRIPFACALCTKASASDAGKSHPHTGSRLLPLAICIPWLVPQGFFYRFLVLINHR